MSRIVVLGGGTAGTIIANRLRRLYAADVAAGRTTITVVDQDDEHVYQPGLLFVPFGLSEPEALKRPRRRQLHNQVQLRIAGIDRVEAPQNRVCLTSGETLDYDVLVVATGTRVAPEETDGLMGAGWQRTMFDFYTLDGATTLRDALDRFTGGRLVINVIDMPIHVRPPCQARSIP